MGFKVGQCVKVFGAAMDASGKYATPGCTEWIATITETDSVAGLIEQVRVKSKDNYCEYWAHPKQCRRLKPREKSVRVRRARLLHAWQLAWAGDTHDFECFCKHLGLEE